MYLKFYNFNIYFLKKYFRDLIKMGKILAFFLAHFIYLKFFFVQLNVLRIFRSTQCQHNLCRKIGVPKRVAFVLIPTLSILVFKFSQNPLPMFDSSNELTITQKGEFERHQHSTAKIKQHANLTAFTSGIFLLISIHVCFS